MIQLQPTQDYDLEYVLAAETAEENKAFVGHYDADGSGVNLSSSTVPRVGRISASTRVRASSTAFPPRPW